MITLRLFQQSDPAAEIGRHTLTEGELVVGRDPAADWVIPDPTKTLSRLHCVFALKDGVVTVRDDSVNGVFLRGGERLERSARIPLKPGQAIVLGDFVIMIDAPRAKAARTSATQTAIMPGAPAGDGSKTGQMLEAFCAGAQIDASVFSGEDPLALMRRLGAVYRRMVLGLGDLMDERTRIKARFGLEWTTVQAADNNPFRWAPPQQVALDLLQPSHEGFLGGEAAVRSSFDDLRLHERGLVAGSRAAQAALVDSLSPDAVGEPLKGQSFLMRNRAAALWAAYVEAHAKACEALADGREGAASRAFREGYDAGVAGQPTGPADGGAAR
jgi:predicted component of type VI protein secretion system